jgi:hypothetical protein
MRTKTTTETYNHLINLLDNNSKVYYGRFGDGDFYIMNGRREKMHKWSPELQQELRDAFTIEDVCYIRGAMVNYPKEPGMAPGVFEPPPGNAEIENWLLNNQKIHPNTIFDSHIMFHYISVFKQDLMVNFLNKYIRPKKKMFIGCVEQEKIEQLVGKIDYYIQVPERDAYYSIGEWWPKVLENIDKVELCLPAAGMAGRVINKRLWKLNKNLHSIDLGSVIDAAVGSSTRTWIDKVGNSINNLLIKKEQMKIFIPTSNKTLYLVEGLLFSLKKYWPDFKNYKIIILGYDEPKFNLDSNISFVKLNTSDEVKNWAIDLKNYFDNINDNYFIYMNDDCPLSRKVNKEILETLKQIAIMNPNNKIGRISLTKCVSNRPHSIVKDYNNFKIIEANQNTEYRTSVQFSIWSKEYFTKHAKENMTPWEYELQPSPKNDGWKILGTSGEYCLDFYHLMRKWGVPDNWTTSCHENIQLHDNKEDWNFIHNIMK